MTRNPPIIGLVGRHYAGQEAVVEQIKSWLPSMVVISIQDYVSAEVRNFFRLSVSEYNKDHVMWEYLQYWWYNMYRRSKNPAYWVQKLRADLEKNKGTLVVVQDVYSLDEFNLVKELGGEIVCVNRNPYHFPVHLSDVQLSKFWYETSNVVQNNGENLKSKVRSILVNLQLIQ